MSSLLWYAACVAGAFAAAYFCMSVFNRIPASWLCDYDEQPDAELYEKRLFFLPHGITMSFLLSASFLCMYTAYSGKIFSFFAGCFICIILLLIALADCKYRIIPDEFTLVLFLAALISGGYDLLSGQHTLHSNWLSLVLGAVCGAALMLIPGLAGKLFFKKEALGFGDVKLFGAVGLLAGFPGVLPVFLLTIFLAFFHILSLLLRRKITKEIYLPLGPYICFAAFLYLAFNRQIYGFIAWYLSLLNL